MKLIKILGAKRYVDGVPMVLLNYGYYKDKSFCFKKLIATIKYKLTYKDDVFKEAEDLVVLRDDGYIEFDEDAYWDNIKFSLTKEGRKYQTIIEYIESSKSKAEFNFKLDEVRRKNPKFFKVFPGLFTTYEDMLDKRSGEDYAPEWDD